MVAAVSQLCQLQTLPGDGGRSIHPGDGLPSDRMLFAEILRLTAELRSPPDPSQA